MSTPSNNRLNSTREAAIISGKDSSMTAQAYAVIISPHVASVMEKPAEISVSKPMGMNSEVLRMKAENVRPASAIHCRAVRALPPCPSSPLNRSLAPDIATPPPFARQSPRRTRRGDLLIG